MRDDSPRLALLMREAGLLSETLWDEYVASQKSGPAQKTMMDILQQSAFSSDTYRELFFYPIKLPLSKSEENADQLTAGLSQTLGVTDREMVFALEANDPGITPVAERIRSLDVHLSPPQITAISEAEGLGKEGYALLARRGVLTSARLEQIVKSGKHPHARPNRVQLASDILALNRLCSLEDFLTAMDQAEGSQLTAGAMLERDGKLTGKQLLERFKEGLDLPSVDIREARIDSELIEQFPASLVRRLMFVPLKRTDTTLSVAMSDPLFMALCDTLSFLTGLVVIPLYAPHVDLLDRIHSLYPQESDQDEGEAGAYAPSTDVLAPSADRDTIPTAGATARPERTANFLAGLDTRVDNLSTVQLVSSIVENAIGSKSTDIHVEPVADGVRVRYRMDGALRHVMSLPPEVHQAAIARIKVLSNMNVTERRRPQDGHFSLMVGSGGRQAGRYDFRVSMIPTQHGEKAVVRILDQQTVLKAMSELGMTDFQERSLRSWILKPYGIILVTGPTGSGKSSTLYSCLNVLNEIQRNILTIEDPVEYQLPGINQIQVDSNIDLTFADGLRSSLRQDPDVIMVGEIRDQETARIAMRAALTGHLVLSTLHTNNAVGAISALRHMGIQSYVISSAVIGVVAQRLIRVLCPKCKEERAAGAAMLRDLGVADSDDGQSLWHAVGCDSCLETGYAGRIGVFEFLVVSESLRRLISDEASEQKLTEAAKEAGLTTLLESAVEKLVAGETSPDEVVKTVLLT